MFNRTKESIILKRKGNVYCTVGFFFNESKCCRIQCTFNNIMKQYVLSSFHVFKFGTETNMNDDDDANDDDEYSAVLSIQKYSWVLCSELYSTWGLSKFWLLYSTWVPRHWWLLYSTRVLNFWVLCQTLILRRKFISVIYPVFTPIHV